MTIFYISHVKNVFFSQSIIIIVDNKKTKKDTDVGIRDYTKMKEKKTVKKNIDVKKVELAVRKKIGKILEEKREEKNWTREKFATKCTEWGFSISEETVKSYEYGNRIPPMHKLICLYYALDVNEILELSGFIKEILNDMYKSDELRTVPGELKKDEIK